MARAEIKSMAGKLLGGFFGMLLIVAACLAIVAFADFQPAVASRDMDSTTIGIGATLNTAADDQVSGVSGRLTNSATDGSSLAQSASRSITVVDPDPVIVIYDYDDVNENTEAAALALGTTDPLPTAPHIIPDESDGWSKGMASSYGVEDCDNNITASGRLLNSWDLTVAVPASQYYLLGEPVAIRYGEVIVVATVTDTGGFESFGRVLDLAPGVTQALDNCERGEWGVREVYYKFL